VRARVGVRSHEGGGCVRSQEVEERSSSLNGEDFNGENFS
jgi:hypothetical protein